MKTLDAWLKAERGRLSKLATDLKITPGAISQWDKVPAERIRDVSLATGIPMRELRPDMFKGMESAA